MTTINIFMGRTYNDCPVSLSKFLLYVKSFDEGNHLSLSQYDTQFRLVFAWSRLDTAQTWLRHGSDMAQSQFRHGSDTARTRLRHPSDMAQIQFSRCSATRFQKITHCLDTGFTIHCYARKLSHNGTT